MAELLTRHSDVLGFRLDMSRAEIETAIAQAGGFGVEHEGDLVVTELNDGRKGSVQFALGGHIRKIVIDSFKLPEHDFYHRLQRRFGMTDDLGFAPWTGRAANGAIIRGFSHWIGRWKGADGATLEIEANTSGPGKPRVGLISTAAPQQVRLFDAAAK